MGGKSKRQRKDAHGQSLRNKGVQQPELALDLLSDELKEQLLASGGQDQLILISGKKKASGAQEAPAATNPAQEPPQELTKGQLRKLKQVQLKKERRGNVAQVLTQLNSSSLSDSHLALLRPLHQRGAKETKKQRLRRALQLERAGVTPTKDQTQELYCQRTVRDQEEEDDEDGSGSEGDVQAAPGKAPPAHPFASKPTASEPPPHPFASKPMIPAAAADEKERPAGVGVDSSDEEEDEEQVAVTKAEQDKLVAVARAEVQRVRQEAGIADDDEDPEEKAQLAAAQQQGEAAAAEAAAVKASGGKAAGLHRVVHIKRPTEIQATRQGLPILAMEQEIIESVAAHDVVVLCGETGCGKTTQVPQFLLEAGYACTAFPERAGCVGVTQPRRVAATSTAGRVAQELGGDLGDVVGYQVRYDRQVGTATRIKFMTDGILLRELQEDFLLRRYSVLLVDEAHERSLNTDLLLGMLSRVVPLRRKLCMQQRSAPGYSPDAPDAVHPLKVIIMSATLRTADFIENKRLFPTPPPVIEVPARQYPVTIHFSRRTEPVDYLGAAFRKVCRIHRELPPGGVLVFVTGQREVEYLCNKIRGKFRARQEGGGDADVGRGPSGRVNAAGAGSTGADSTKGAGVVGEHDAEMRGPEEMDGDGAQKEEEGAGGDRFGDDMAETAQDGPLDDLEKEGGHDDDYDDEVSGSEDEDEEEVQMLGGETMTPEEIAEAEKRFEEQLGFKVSSGAASGAGAVAGEAGANGPAPVHVLPLYAMLPAGLQSRVFQPSPAGHRLIVVATNVAETSLTIPGIRYVVDAGRSKQRLLDTEAGGMARFEVRWVSQAAAAQRAGRAGRTGPGHTYRLFSSAHYNDCMAKHTPPEICNTALEGVVLVLKSMGVEKVQNFPFPSPPESSALSAAERCLIALCAIHHKSGALTDVGKAMAAFPIGPRNARMLLEVAAWQLKLAGAASEAAAAAGSRAPPTHIAAQALPYAVALAAVLSVESPFMHIDTVRQKQEQQEGGRDADDSDEEGGPRVTGEDREAQRVARQKQAQARQAQATLRVAGSDALSALRALCGYEGAMASGGPEAVSTFCTVHHLHQRILQEAADLHRQLLRLLAQPSSPAAVAEGPPPLAQQLAGLVEEQGVDGMLEAVAAGKMDKRGRRGEGLGGTLVQDCLRRALAVGWVDCVARRVRTAEQLARQMQMAEAEGGTKKKHAVRYVACSVANAHGGGAEASAGAVRARVAAAARAGVDEDVSGDVYLHPRSALYSTAPEYVAYAQLVQTAKRPYMSVVTAVQAEWLIQSGTPLAVWSAPLADPAPVYRAPPTDAVLAWHDVSYGQHTWPMPRCLRPHPDKKVAATVMATALLEGHVVHALTEFRPAWVSAPSVASRPEMQGVARVGELVGALARAGIASRHALVTCWVKEPTFLQRELQGWLPPAQRVQLVQKWPSIVQQALSTSGQAGEGGDGAGGKGQKRKGKQDGDGAQERVEVGEGEKGGGQADGGRGKKRKGGEEGVGARAATELTPMKKNSKKRRQNAKGNFQR